MKTKSLYNNLICKSVKVLALVSILAFSLFMNVVSVEAASVSKELYKDTTFLIQEFFSIDDREIILTVYDRVTGEVMGHIKVELYYEDSDIPITGSDGNYLTDENGEIIYKVSGYTTNDSYHIEINAPGYYPYVGEDFILSGNMDFVIYLDPLPEAPEIPEVEDPEDPEPEEPTEPEVPEPEEEQEEIPNEEVKTGDETSVLVYMSTAILALVGMLIYFLFSKSKEDEEDEE